MKILSIYPLVSLRKLEELIGRPRKDLRRLAESAGRFYKPFDMRRIGDSKWRHIDNPQGELKNIQRQIQRNILSTCHLPHTILGGVSGFTIKDNLEIHLAQPNLIRLDLRNCYPNTSHHKIYRVYKENLGCSKQIASLLTKLTTFQRRTPQGAHTSTTLVNLTLVPMHNELQKLAAELDLKITVWVDDIAISGKKAFDAIGPAIAIIKKHGYSVRRKKIELMRNSSRQTLTGGVLNRKISAGRRGRIEEIRQRIRSSGPNISMHELQSIKGSINFVKWLCPEQGAMLKREAKKHLPQVAPIKHVPPRIETRRCRNASRHKND